MKSNIATIDALLAEEKQYPLKQPHEAKDTLGIRIEILGFENVRYRERPQRPISKIVNPVNIIQ
ncbi:hypothetical protein [Fluviicola sp.]|jgi:hypothetical protein|uniref:hypothetical protein n=1 Tax=Fluviicola sp. TaxID=1917219 RepID=UPI002830430D|nr:hypothetical protein [Fluviicola sp.]MDR0803253.1 hypothetical protein [Fluviicola sp.]